MAFQDNLRKYRESAGYTQAKDFADALGIKYTTYTAYENQGREPKYDTLVRIGELLNVSIDTLLGVGQKTNDPLKKVKAVLKKSRFDINITGDKLAVYKDGVIFCGAYDRETLCELISDIITESEKMTENMMKQRMSLLFNPKHQEQITAARRKEYVDKVVEDFVSAQNKERPSE